MDNEVIMKYKKDVLESILADMQNAPPAVRMAEELNKATGCYFSQ